MAKIDVPQRQYLQSRVSGIYNKKSSDITNRGKASPAEMAKRILAGKAKLLPKFVEALNWAVKTNQAADPSGFTLHYFFQNYDFSSLAPKVEDVSKAIEKLQQEYQRINDEIMLGDCEEAIKMLAKFDAMKF